MDPLIGLIEKAQEIEEKIGYVFQNKQLLALAFVHRSFFNEHKQDLTEHNERLEFLGDSILGLVISEYLYALYPHEAEGVLSRLRAHIVEVSTCARFVQKLSIPEYLLLGKGEQRNEGRGKESILGDLFEALLGAIFLDGGIDSARKFFWEHFTEEVQIFLQEPARNWKAELQEYCQRKTQKPPLYKVLKEFGPDHNKTFTVAAYLDEVLIGMGKGSSKKEAEQMAAEDALNSKGIRTDG